MKTTIDPPEGQECEFSDECPEPGSIYLDAIAKWSCGLHSLLYP